MKQMLLLLLLSGDSWQLNACIKSQAHHDISSGSLLYLFAKSVVVVVVLTSLADYPASLLLKSFVSICGWTVIVSNKRLFQYFACNYDKDGR